MLEESISWQSIGTFFFTYRGPKVKLGIYNGVLKSLSWSVPYIIVTRWVESYPSPNRVKALPNYLGK